jgi:ferritin-like metal-binding protein YciE
MEKNLKNTKTMETTKDIKKQVVKNISDTKSEVKKLDSQKNIKNQKSTSKIKKIFQQKSGKLL